MGSAAAAAAGGKAHAVCIPYPAQGHINPMLKLAKLLHSQGLHITFVNTEYNHRRLIKSGAGASPPSDLGGRRQPPDDFRFETIPDGLPPSDLQDTTQDTATLCDSTAKNFLVPFRSLIDRLNDSSSAAASAPPVSCIVSDGGMSFTLDVADELGIPNVQLWTPSACGVMCMHHYQQLAERGLVPLKDESDLTNGYLDTAVDWVPGMMRNLRLRDFPSFVRITSLDDIMFNFVIHVTRRASMSSAIVMNTFDDLERPVLEAMVSMLHPAPIYTLGPLHLLSRRHISPESPLSDALGSSSLWKEDPGCTEWLDGREPRSVVYVNFGSITVMTNKQLLEFAWGLANSGRDFLWVIRPDLVRGERAVLPPEFAAETRARSLVASWCPQEEVLSHPAVGGFLTHSGWNSTIESIGSGVPMLCWPFFSEQQTNCRYACAEWGVGMEIDSQVRREEVQGLIGELMGGDKGKEMRRKAAEWKESAARATEPGGSSFMNLQTLVKQLVAAKEARLG